MLDDALEELLGDYLLESRERLERIEQLLLGLEGGGEEGRSEALQETRRQLHTLKGNSGMMGLAELQDLAHDLEDRVEQVDPLSPAVDPILEGLDRFRDQLAALERGPESTETSLRVARSRLDHLIGRMTELVIARNRLAGAMAGADPRTSEEESGRLAGWERAEEARLELERILSAAESEILALRMAPLAPVLQPLRRLVRDESARAGKQVRLLIRGEETPLDRTLSEFAAEALGHLVRNAVVHGIETPAERTGRGKPARGTVQLEARAEADGILIDVLDDGAGIDREALLAAARSRDLEVSAEDDVHALLFHPGLSTAESADRAAGRGIGMAAVLEAAHRLGGTIEVATRPGQGTGIRLRLPWSVAITDALLLEADGERYALPASAIVETGRLPAAGPEGGETLEWRGQKLPLLDLGRFLGGPEAARRRDYLAVVEAEGRHCGLMVDGLGELQKIVVKNLDEIVGRPPGISGSTVLGDGRVVMILDPPALAAEGRAAGAA